MDPPQSNTYFSGEINDYKIHNPGYISDECAYSNQRLCSQDMSNSNCIWCVDSSKRGRCIPLKDFTQSNCPNSYKTEQFRNNGLNTLVALSIAIMIILFLGLIYNGKRR